MAEFSIAEIIEATGAKLIHGEKNKLVKGIGTDSRNIAPGMLFIPLRGERFDGHEFLSAAIGNGAVAVFTENENVAPEGATILHVENTLRALQDLARYHRRRVNIEVIAVTGSSGKTTTKNLISSVLEEQYSVCKTEKNHNNEIGLPLTLLKLTEEYDVCVVEMGMRGLGQIAELTSIAEPTIGVVTNVGTAHMELLGNRRNIARAKAELIEALPAEGTAVLNMDDEFVAGMEKKAKGRVIGYGMCAQAMVQALDIEYETGRTRFTCRSFDEVFPVKMSLVGEHNVYNALAAISVARTLGITSYKIQRALANTVGEEMRQEVIEIDGKYFINDAYNANPQSVQAGIESLKQYGKGRKIVVLGDMLELGSAAEKYHTELATPLFNAGVEVLITVGELSAKLAKKAKEYGLKSMACSDTKEAAQELSNIIEQNDIILIKGSRSIQMENIIKAMQERNR